MFRFGLILITALATAPAVAQSTYQLTSATPATIPAGANGASEALSGTLPDFTQGVYQLCFYTGSGSAAITPATVNGATILAVPAATIQGISAGSFTAANNFTVQALVYIVLAGTACDGNFDPTLTNTLSIPIAEPTLAPYAGPLDIPQANSATTVLPPPSSITLSGSNFAANTIVNFASFGNKTPRVISSSELTVPLPAAFASSPVGTSLPVSICNTGGANSYCSVATPSITLTIVAQAASTGNITVTPSPAAPGQSTMLAARFSKAPTASGEPGAPSGSVTFTVAGTALSPVPLKLDKTATFTAQSTLPLVLPKAATPVISPAAGTYTSSQTATITDATPGAQIYYTTDNSPPTTASNLYAGPFGIFQTETIQAIAIAPNYLQSAIASSAIVIHQNPPAKLAFVNQPVNTGTSLVIKPPVSVALQDSNGQPVTNTTNPVTIAIGSNPGDGTLSGTLTQTPVNGIATFPDLSIDNIANGYTLIASSPNLASATSAAFNITAYPISMNVTSVLIGIGSTLTGNFTLSQPAPAGGLVVTLASSAPAFVTISPATVTVPQGQSTGSFTYTGVAIGTSTLTAKAPKYLVGSVDVTATDAQVSLATIPPVAPGQTVSLALSLAKPAPPGGTIVSFTSSNPAVATVSSSVFVPAGQQTAAANPQVTGVTIGTTTIKATAPGYAPATRAVNVTVVATFSPASITLNLTTSTTTKLNISAPAQVGGITFTLTSDDPTVATVPASVTVAQGATSVLVPITGVKNGSTTIRANSPGVAEATIAVNVNSAINVSAASTGVHLQTSIGSFFYSNPTSPVTVTVTVSDPTVATISSDQTVIGVKTLTFTNITSSIPTIYVQGQKAGTTTLTVSAPGYTAGSNTITVSPSGFVFYYYTSSFSTTTFSSPTSLTVITATLDPTTFAVTNEGYGINPGTAAVAVPLTSSDTTIGTVSPTVTFKAGDSSNSASFKPAAAGTTNLTIGAAPAGFSKASNYQQITATVTAPAINVYTASTGVNLEYTIGASLAVTPPSAETVTVTVADPSIVTLSSDPKVRGTQTITFANTTYVPTIYIQGQKVGSTTVTVSAPGYTSGTATVTVNASGFAFYYYTQSFSTTTFSGPTSLTLITAMLDPSTFAVLNEGYAINPGVAPVSVPLTSSNTTVGTLTPSVTFKTGDSSNTASFQPLAAGTANLTIGAAPAGFSKASNYQQVTGTVTAPTITVYNTTTGVKLENSGSASLSAAPPAAEAVTVTVSDATVATISSDPNVPGTKTIIFPSVTNSIPTFYVQGQKVGTTAITVTAPGYTSGTGSITVDASGFAFYYYTGSFTTTTFSSSTNLTLITAVLDPMTFAVVNEGLAISPGVSPATIPLTSSAPSIGTVAPASIPFGPGDTTKTATFQPIAAGTTNLTIGAAPAGFSKPSNYQQIVATVTAPSISVSDVTTGVNLQNTVGIYLGTAPPNPVTVTVTINGTGVATISTDPAVAGTKTLTFTNITNANYLPTIYVQGQTIGSTTITASAAGYTNGNGNVTVYPSGFTYYYNQSFTTTTTSAPTTLTIYASILNPGVLTINNVGLKVNPGAAISVPVTSSNTTVGTITTSPLVFNGGDSSQTTSFKPLSTGTSQLTIGVPSGFSTPSQGQQITATVQ